MPFVAGGSCCVKLLGALGLPLSINPGCRRPAPEMVGWWLGWSDVTEATEATLQLAGYFITRQLSLLWAP